MFQHRVTTKTKKAIIFKAQITTKRAELFRWSTLQRKRSGTSFSENMKTSEK